MNNIEKLFVPYEIAVMAKEKGFDTKTFFNTWNVDEKQMYPPYSHGIVMESKHLIIAPIYQQLTDWFREEHDLHIEVLYQGSEDKDYTSFIDGISDMKGSKEIFTGTYYEALNKAIVEAFKLI